MLPPNTAPLYMPALKWKQGEQHAVRLLTSGQKARIQPLVEIQDRTYDWVDRKYKKSWDKHLEDVAKATAKDWGTDHDIAVDQQIQDGQTLSSNPGTPWEYLFEQLWSLNVRAVPVLSSWATGSEAVALIKVSKAHRRRRWVLRFRLATEGVLPTVAVVQAWFTNSMVAVGERYSEVDAVLDLGYIGSQDPKAMAPGTAQLLQAIASLGAWRAVGLTSGGFPVNLAGMGIGNKQIPRKDWDLYKRVLVRSMLEKLKIAYGDYCVAHQETFDDDPRKMVMSSNIRYSHWDHWYVLKGKNTRDYGNGPYKDLCRLLVALPIFMSAPFSQGDANYEKTANDPKAGPGGAREWRRDATNHHLHVVLHQLANLPEF